MIKAIIQPGNPESEVEVVSVSSSLVSSSLVSSSLVSSSKISPARERPMLIELDMSEFTVMAMFESEP